MSGSKEKACLAIVLAYALNEEIRQERCRPRIVRPAPPPPPTKPKRLWADEPYQRRADEQYKKRAKYPDQNEADNPCLDLLVSGPSDYGTFLLTDDATFKDLLALVSPLIEKKDTPMRAAIPAAHRLAATLNFLAAGLNFEQLKVSTAIAPQTLSRIILETCDAIVVSLLDNIRLPKAEFEWSKRAIDFDQQWNFPNCVGVIGGKHVEIQKPTGTQSAYQNYKRTFSVVLMVIVDANYAFTMVEVGARGGVTEDGVFGETAFSRLLEDNALGLPVPGHHDPTRCDEMIDAPFVFVGDESFPQLVNLMTPYEQTCLVSSARETYNYRMGRVHRVLDNALGILAVRFRVLQTSISLSPAKVSRIVSACCHLHNYLLARNREAYLDGAVDAEDPITGEVLDGSWRSENVELLGLKALDSGTTLVASAAATDARMAFCDYFAREEELSLQHMVKD